MPCGAKELIVTSLLMEDIMLRVSFSGIFMCVGIALQIELAFAFSWKNITRNITSCEHEDVRLTWEYELDPGEYVKAKTWFTGENKTAKRIAYWIDTDGLTIEPAYRDRVTVAGNGNDSLLLRDITTSDEGMYTLIPSFPLSSEPDPRLALNLTIYISPLKEEGCCKPDISASHDELRAFLHSEQGCGKPSPILTWKVTRNNTVKNEKLILGDKDKGGMYKVCVMGPAVDRCFNGDKEALCKSYTVHTERSPETVEVETPLPTGVWIGIVVAILILAILPTVMAIFFCRQLQKRRKEDAPFIRLEKSVRLRIPLLEAVLDVKSLTKELVHIYHEKSQFQKADSDLKLQTEIYEGSILESDIDINIYRNVFKRNEQSLRRILIQGEVGCGKKTWCNTLTQEWCKAHAPNLDLNEISASGNDNITFLQGYDLLFNISLSKVENFADINGLLRNLHISMLDQLNIDIYEYVKKHNTIIIIQGLDEYRGDPSNVKKILSDEGLEHAVVIITSTPKIWSMNYQETTSLHRKIHVKGLDTNEMKKRAEKILKDDGFPPTVIAEFFKSIKSNELQEFTTEPVFFPFLVKMWQMNCILPSTRSEFLLNVLENQIKEKRLLHGSSSDDYRFDFDNNIVLKDQQFIIHYGKIVHFLGQIALRILSDNKEGIMFNNQVFDDIFTKQNFTAEDSCQFIRDFCVGINLVSAESNKEGIIQAFFFQHKMMLAFLAAIYISTLKGEQREPVITEFQSLTEFVQFLRYESRQPLN